MQQTNFPIEIIIHDDASTDNTANIIREYQGKHPHLIKTILQRENQYSQGKKVFPITFKEAQGKYIALCEGDDYWTDPLKLQKQVDFLEANPDFAICFHKVKILEDGEFKEDYITKVPATVSTIDDLAWGNYIHTCSCVFRNRVPEILGPNFSKSPLGDYYLHMMNAQYGKLYALDALMAVYRVHDASMWSRRNKIDKMVKTLEARKCILSDLSIRDSKATVNLIDKCINYALEARQHDNAENLIKQLVIIDSEDYVIRLVERLSDSMDETKKLRTQLSEGNARLSNSLFLRVKNKLSRLLVRQNNKSVSGSTVVIRADILRKDGK
jgi:glycosyltransferase involved in cell wall biosynthesis